MIIKIKTEYIKLDQLLKYANVVESGANAKEYILNGQVLVNNEIETKRGKKLYKGDIVTFEGEKIIIDLENE
ncbi:S4 domain-containing protein YaaA [Caviibacter abscessus]|uniref:S4 domain-containing protein YaaA n=1 Tax=Caviibacter abscessus TaxID=1766719 RepID=UPI000AA59450|nr:S4 domain-containing protein YaaA [Caviibacter abscessus]